MAMNNNDYDYETPLSTQELDSGVEAIIKQLAQYQSHIKTMGAAALVILATALIGLGVEFIYTIPLLILVPFLAQLWCRRPIALLIVGYASVSLFSYLGTVNSQDWVVLGIFSFVSITLGVLCGLMVGWTKKLNRAKSVTLLTAVGILLLAGIFVSWRFTGTPLDYVHTLITVNRYIEEKYADRPEVTFIQKAVHVDRGSLWFSTFGDPTVEYLVDANYSILAYSDTVVMSISWAKNISNEAEQIYGIDRVREHPWKLFPNRDGFTEEIVDGYEGLLDTVFDNEQQARLTPFVLSAVDFVPTQVFAYTNIDYKEASPFREEYLNYYAEWKPLSPNMIAGKKALEEKVCLNISWNVPSSEIVTFRANNANYSDDLQYLSKEDFIRRATAIHNTLVKHQPNYEEAFIYVGLQGSEKIHTYQSVSFKKGDSLETMLASYEENIQENLQ